MEVLARIILGNTIHCESFHVPLNLLIPLTNNATGSLELVVSGVNANHTYCGGRYGFDSRSDWGIFPPYDLWM